MTNLKRTLIRLTLMLALLLASLGGPLAAPEPAAAAPLDLLQFQSAGHVLGFGPGRMYVSNGTYALRVEFVDAGNVAPQAAASTPADGGAAPALTPVTYRNLWPGITLTYDAGGGIARSTYTLAPGANPSAIRLRYNAQVTLEAGGSLRVRYETGEMRESAPLAWQEIDGRRIPVEIAFQTSAVLETSEVSFRVGRYDPRYPLTIDPALTWNTFLGGSGSDLGHAIAVDGSGNVYVAGYSTATWGSSPVRLYDTYHDAFVAKLGPDGSLAWNTFLGGGGYDQGHGIAVDGSGDVYVVGYSSATWGSPVRPYADYKDVFVAKLGTNGSLTWNTFLGGGSGEASEGYGIAVDGSGNVYVTGYSDATWGTPVHAHLGGNDAFAAKLGSDGTLTWNTFLGGSDDDEAYGIAVDGSGNVYVVGYSSADWGWGTTVRAYTSGEDTFAAKLGSDGSLTWNTFLGGSGDDRGHGIAVDGSGNAYVAGYSGATWGNPERPYTAGNDTYAAKLGSNGSLTWNTFLGGSGDDRGHGIAVDGSGNVYVAGYSTATWGTPVHAHAGSCDAFAAKLGPDGSLAWNAFLGGSGDDRGHGIAVDGSGNVYVAGYSTATWGTPVHAHAGSCDAFAAKLGPLTLTKSVSPASAKPGEAITYTIAFSNTGAITATNVVITDTVPVSVTGASYSSSGVALTLVPGFTYVWTAPDLLENDGGIITITGVLSNSLAAGVFTNTVTMAVSGTVETTEISLPVQNVAPVANAGSDQTVNPGDTVTLDGSGSDDANGDALTYLWARTGGESVTLSDSSAESPTFTAPSAAGRITFTLTVTDVHGLPDATPDEVVITVTNVAPVADAGSDQTVNPGDTVTLDGSGSDDANGDALTYLWARTGGESVTLSDSSAESPTFTAPSAAGRITFTLTVTDVHGLPDATPDEVVITVTNVAPVADAGSDQTVNPGDTVTLDGSGSDDANGDALTYLWARTGGENITLSDSSAESPTFTAPSAAGRITFTLTVTDVHGMPDATPDEVVVTVNAAPVADAGDDQTVLISTTVTLDGSASSDPDGHTPLTYGWAQTGGSPTVTLSDPAVQQPTFTAPGAPTVLTFTLTVTDTGTLTGTDEVVVTVEDLPNLALTKSVSPASAKPGEAITYTIAFSNTAAITATNVVITDALSANITGASFTSSGVALTQVPGSRYVWTAPDLAQNEGGVITITGVLTKPLAAGIFSNTVTMAVSGTQKVATTPLTVQNVAPVADAGVDQSKVVSQTVTLDGSGSSDDNGDTLIYGWTQTGGSPTVTLSDPAAQKPTFTAPSAATVLTFTLTVTDTGTLVGTDEVVVTVVEGYIYYFPIIFKSGSL